MKFFALIDTNPQSPNFGRTQNVIRVHHPHYERWDHGKHIWIEDPALLKRMSGLGGDGYDYREIAEEQAYQIVDMLLNTPRKPPYY